MPKNILINLNVILDVLQERRGFEASKTVLELGESGSYRLHVSAHAVTTFAYLLESAKVPKAELGHQIDWLLETFSIVPVDEKILRLARSSRIKDYEDAVVEQAALAGHAVAIVTRNIKDFRDSRVPVFAPANFVKSI